MFLIFKISISNFAKNVPQVNIGKRWKMTFQLSDNFHGKIKFLKYVTRCKNLQGFRLNGMGIISSENIKNEKIF